MGAAVAAKDSLVAFGFSFVFVHSLNVLGSEVWVRQVRRNPGELLRIGYLLLCGTNDTNSSRSLSYLLIPRSFLSEVPAAKVVEQAIPTNSSVLATAMLSCVYKTQQRGSDPDLLIRSFTYLLIKTEYESIHI